MTESLGFRESMKEANIKSKLDKTEKAYWDNLPISEKRQFVELYKHDKNNCISIITSKVKEIDPTHENAFVKAKMIKFFKTQGIDEPTETTKKLLINNLYLQTLIIFIMLWANSLSTWKNKLNIITTCLNKNKILYKLLN